jgi:predicted nucleic acid-binding protein
VILADSSAWIEYLRRTGSPMNLRLRELLEGDGPLITTEVVHMELLAAPRVDETAIQRLLGRLPLFPVGGIETYQLAAELARACRRRGETVRNMTDCLIAAVAIREGAAVLHRDADFEVLARHTPLRLDVLPAA